MSPGRWAMGLAWRRARPGRGLEPLPARPAAGRRQGSGRRGGWPLAAALGVWLAAALALAGVGPAAGAPAATAAFWRSAQLTAPDGGSLGRAAAYSAWPLAGRSGHQLRLTLPDGRAALAPAPAAVILPGPPQSHRRRLEILARAAPSPDLAPRLLAGRLETGDGQRTAELAWGPPWRRYMVNLFQDEEHLVYRDPDGRPLLLRFRAGQLLAPPPSRPPWVAAPGPER